MAYITVGQKVLTETQKARIVAELIARKAQRPCARCGNTTFSILDTVFTNNPGPAFPGASTQTFPTIAAVCTNCGAVYHHLLGFLVPLGEFGLG